MLQNLLGAKLGFSLNLTLHCIMPSTLLTTSYLRLVPQYVKKELKIRGSASCLECLAALSACLMNSSKLNLDGVASVTMYMDPCPAILLTGEPDQVKDAEVLIGCSMRLPLA